MNQYCQTIDKDIYLSNLQLPKKQKLRKNRLSSVFLIGGRTRIRTLDPFGVNEVL